jgi:Leucine-rich repeat (LRR) protein
MTKQIILAAMVASWFVLPAAAQTAGPKGSTAEKRAGNGSAVGPEAIVVQRIEARGGFVVRERDGSISEVSLARTWATDEDLKHVAQIKTLKRLDLSFTLVTDKGIKELEQLRQLEDLNLETAEALTDASMNYVRNIPTLRRLKVRGVDITDVGMPAIAQMTGLRSLDLSHTMLEDVGLENLPALTELEELYLGGDMITGINLNFLKLLPKLKKLSLDGIQRRNAGACWTPRVTDLDLDTISLLSGLEDLDLGVGLNLGRGGKPAAPGGGNCKVTGGIQVTDLGLAKLGKLTKLRRLNLSGARLTPAGLKVLARMPLEHLSLWNCEALDDAAASVLAEIPTLTNLDLSLTKVSDAGLQTLAKLPNLKALYLSETKVTPQAVDAFQKSNPKTFVSWARRLQPRGAPLQGLKDEPAE